MPRRAGRTEEICLNVALLDDERAETERLSALIGAYALEKNYDIHCKCFQTGAALLAEPKFDLYILDFKMDGMDGIEVAEALQKKFSNAVTVCYLTNYESAAAQIINRRIYADGFLKKPVQPEELYEKLDKFYRASYFNRLELKRGGQYCTVYTQDVVYIEASGKKSVVHTQSGEEVFNYLLSEIAALVLPGGSFFRIHRSFIVNMRHVASYNGKSVTMKNGVTLPLKSRDFRAAYKNYVFDLG